METAAVVEIFRRLSDESGVRRIYRAPTERLVRKAVLTDGRLTERFFDYRVLDAREGRSTNLS
jgi:hypothetical protein